MKFVQVTPGQYSVTRSNFFAVKGYSGILLARNTREQDFLYRQNVVCTKKSDSLWIFSLPFADLYDLIDIVCLTVPSIWGLVPWIFSNIYGAKSQYSVADIFDGF